MGLDRGTLPLPNEASDSLGRPARKDGDKLGASVTIVKECFGGDRAAGCIGSINHGRTMSCECFVGLGACLCRWKVRNLERVSIGPGIIGVSG